MFTFIANIAKPSIICLLLIITALHMMPLPALADVPQTAKIIRAEALRSSNDASGRPLPLAAHWHRDSLPLNDQLELIRQGEFLLPWINYYRKMKTSKIEAHADGFATLREWRLPLTLITGGQWEADFYESNEFIGRAATETGLFLNLDNVLESKVSPLSPIEPWTELGHLWTDNAAALRLQELYPDPPRIFFVSNNETKLATTADATNERRFVDLYGTDVTRQFAGEVFGDGWIALYAALIEGMKDGLTDPDWKKNSRFMAYQNHALGSKTFGRWGAWYNNPENSMTTATRFSPWYHVWDGAVAENYDNNWEREKTAYKVWSMQVEAMNSAFVKEEALKQNPDFWWELIIWDGDWPNKTKESTYTEFGLEYTPDLYSGWVQYSMWITTPRVVREWRKSDDERSRWWDKFEVVLDAVRRVHKSPVLQKFWRQGELVANTSRTHPFSNSLDATPEWANIDRWFHLTTSLDPELPAKLQLYKEEDNVTFPIYTLARIIGSAPNREWLVYAHSPTGSKADVTVDIPDYKTVQLPIVSVGGAFFHLRESDGSVEQIKDIDEVVPISAPKLKLRQD